MYIRRFVRFLEDFREPCPVISGEEYATRLVISILWRKIPVAVLLDHTLVCYERFDRDMFFIRRLYVPRSRSLFLHERFVQKEEGGCETFSEYYDNVEIPVFNSR